MLPSVAPLVSLEQTKTFTYVVLDARGSLADISRSITFSPVHVEELKIDFREDMLAESTHSARLDELLACFDPTHLHLLARPRPMKLTRVHFTFAPDLAWSQLRQMSFTHSLADRELADVAVVADCSPVDLVYDLAGHLSEADVEDTLRFVQDDLGPKEKEATAFGHVQIWVSNNDEVAMAEDMLADCSCTSIDIGVKT